MAAQAGDANPSSCAAQEVSEASRQTIRSRIQIERNALDAAAGRLAGIRLADRLRRLSCARRARCVAGYVPQEGEIDVMPALIDALARSKRVFLPVIDSFRPRKMRFAEWWPDTPMARSRFGIPEPLRSDRSYMAPGRLDMVLVPLVAFDQSGNRLGMGGGYYDRCFSFLSDRLVTRPVLVGVAYELQKVAAIDSKPWDVPLSWVITESASYRCR